MTDGLDASRRRAHRNVVLTAAIAGLGGLLFGYDAGIIAGALLFIKGDFGLGQGRLRPRQLRPGPGRRSRAGRGDRRRPADRHGRRLMILLAALVFIAGALASAATPGLGS